MTLIATATQRPSGKIAVEFNEGVFFVGALMLSPVAWADLRANLLAQGYVVKEETPRNAKLA